MGRVASRTDYPGFMISRPWGPSSASRSRLDLPFGRRARGDEPREEGGGDGHVERLDRGAHRDRGRRRRGRSASGVKAGPSAPRSKAVGPVRSTSSIDCAPGRGGRGARVTPEEGGRRLERATVTTRQPQRAAHGPRSAFQPNGSAAPPAGETPWPSRIGGPDQGAEVARVLHARTSTRAGAGCRALARSPHGRAREGHEAGRRPDRAHRVEHRVGHGNKAGARSLRGG